MIIYNRHEFGQPVDDMGNVIVSDKPRLFDGQKVIEFETIQERDEYLSTLPVIWDKAAYAQQVNEAHTALYVSMWEYRDYMSEAEVMTWEDTLDRDALSLEWKAEAKAMLNWYRKTCITVYKYLEDVTEATAMPVEEFIQSLPDIHYLT